MLPLRTLSLLAAFALALGACKPKHQPPATLWPIPSWQLTNQDNQPFGSSNLVGRVYVANFIFTRCTATCPMLTSKMATLATRLRAQGDRVRFVSFSVDPSHDTPARLREFGVRYHADFTRWTFVTGEHPTVLAAIDRGFRISSGMPEQPQAQFDPIALAHSNHFALVDGRGAMRGAYSVETPEGIERLALDAEALAQ
ncbi:MAG: SCO family protein [Deltaproteobacteria bacterium]|nr:SCO family protein [Deltaproteobacteria bacterium]